MAEPDHIIIKPIPNLSQDGLPTAFPFFYIEPKKEEVILRKFFPEENGPITNIDPIGNSPVIIYKACTLFLKLNLIKEYYIFTFSGLICFLLMLL